MISRSALFTLLIGMAMTACKKDESNAGLSPAPVAAGHPLDAFFEQDLADATQLFTLNAAAGGTIIGPNGVQVTFVPGAFLAQDGAQVSGAVNVELVEILDVGHMVLMNKPTLGNDNGTLKMLTSGGEISITATQGGSALGLIPNGATVRIPCQTPDPDMALYQGEVDSNDRFVWEPDITDVLADTDSSAWYYAFPLNSLQWINCDYYPPGSYTVFPIAVPEVHTADNTMLFVVIPSLNGVSGVWNGTSDFTTDKTPLGYDAVIVGLSEINGNHYSSFTPITVAAGITPSIVFSPTTLTQFRTDVLSL
jgi:hypothetical protein